MGLLDSLLGTVPFRGFEKRIFADVLQRRTLAAVRSALRRSISEDRSEIHGLRQLQAAISPGTEGS